MIELGFPGGLAVKNSPASAEAMGLIPGLGRSPGKENGNPLQYSCLDNSMEEPGACKESFTPEWLNNKNNQVYSKVIQLFLFLFCRLYSISFPRGASGKEPICQCRRHKRHRFNPCVRKIPWKRAWHPTPVFLPRESHRQRNLAGCSPWGRKNQTRLSN